MKLKINYNGKNFLAEVKKGKYSYKFELLRVNDLFIWKETYGFQYFSCSISCRLKHYKDFKNRIFDNRYSYRKFIEM